MSCRSFFFSTLLVLFLGPSLLAAIHGVVTDPSGAPVPGAVVYLLPGAGRIARADGAGRFHFPGPPAGVYTLVAGAQDLVEVAAGQRRGDGSLPLREDLAPPRHRNG